MSDNEWNTGEEDGLTPTQMVALGKAIQVHGSLALEWDGVGFVADIAGVRWCAYGLLTELLEDVGDE